MKTNASLFLILACFLFSNSIISQGKKWPDPKRDTYSINSLSPSGDGWILSKLNFSSEVTLEERQRDKYTWWVKVLFRSCNIDGYVYNGVSYSKNELKNDFKLNIDNRLMGVTLKSVIISFNNGKSFKSNYLPKNISIGTQKRLNYNKNDETTAFSIRRISILDNTRDLGIESKIKRELSRRERQKKNEEFKKKEEERLRKLEEERNRKEEEAKKLEEEQLLKLREERKEEERLRKLKERSESDEIANAKKLADAKEKTRKERLKTEKIARDRQYEIEKKALAKKQKEEADYYQKRRETKKAIEKEKKRKFEKSKRDLTKSVGDAFTGIFNGLSDGSLSYFRAGIGIRSDTKEVGDGSFYLSTPSNMTYEVGLGVGGPGGFYVGVGFPDSTWDESSGFSWLVGLDYFFYQDENYDLDFGINAEFGMGNSEETDNRTNYSLTSTEEATFYSIGAQIRVLKYVYISYNYGFYSGESKTTYTDNRSDRNEDGDGNFTKIGFSLVLAF